MNIIFMISAKNAGFILAISCKSHYVVSGGRMVGSPWNGTCIRIGDGKGASDPFAWFVRLLSIYCRWCYLEFYFCFCKTQINFQTEKCLSRRREAYFEWLSVYFLSIRISLRNFVGVNINADYMKKVKERNEERERLLNSLQKSHGKAMFGNVMADYSSGQ